MDLEKLMFGRVPLWLVLCIVLSGIVLLVIFGGLVSYAAGGGQRLQAHHAISAVDRPDPVVAPGSNGACA